MLEAKAKDQGHKHKCSPKKRSSQKFFWQSSQKNVFQKIFQALHKILTIQKIVLSSSRGQANFRGLEASRPRTSKCVLEDEELFVQNLRREPHSSITVCRFCKLKSCCYVIAIPSSWHCCPNPNCNARF